MVFSAGVGVTSAVGVAVVGDPPLLDRVKSLRPDVFRRTATPAAPPSTV
jgi:hypothetical protein